MEIEKRHKTINFHANFKLYANNPEKSQKAANGFFLLETNIKNCCGIFIKKKTTFSYCVSV